jgi:hypothetical protein
MMGLASRLNRLQRDQVCSDCDGQDEATLVIRTRVVQAGDTLSPRSPMANECPACGRRIRIKRVEVVRDRPS